MNRKIIIFNMVLLLLLPLAFADLGESLDLALSEVEGEELPKPLGTLFGNEQINFYLALNNGEEIVISLVTEDKVIKSVSTEEVTEPSLNVYSDEDTVRKLLASNNPVPLLKKALDEKKITYKAVGLLNKVKFAFLSVFSNVATLFQETVEGSFDQLAEETKEEPEVEEEPEEELEDENELTGEVVAEIKEPEFKTHVIKMDDQGFDPQKTTVGVGDKVIWKNIRTGNIDNAMVIGVRNCREVKSGLFGPGEEFSWTFDEPKECVIVDGIMTTVESKLVIGG